MDMINHETQLENELLKKIREGKKVSSISDMPLELIFLLEKTIITQWNCEYWGGMNYLNCVHLAPTPVEAKIVERIGKEELGHAKILAEGPLLILGINPVTQKAKDVKTQSKILRIFQYPEYFTTWAHFLMFNHLQDRSAALQLAELKNGPFEPLNEAIRKIELEEDGHIAHGENGIRDLAKTKQGKLELQKALNDWLPHALAVFGAPDSKSKNLKMYQKYGLKKSNDALRERYKVEVRPLLKEVGISSPLLSQQLDK